METTRLNSKVQRIFNDLLQQDLISRYQLLGRLQSDCEYFLNWGDGSIGRLWTGSVEFHILHLTISGSQRFAIIMNLL